MPEEKSQREKKTEMHERHAELGKSLQDLALAAAKTNPNDSCRCIELGVDIERQAINDLVKM